MRPEDNKHKNELDQAIEEIRNERIPENAIRQAGDRVWARIAEELQPQTVEHISGCGDFQALFPAYREEGLSEARTMLVRDHLHECVACRKAFMRETSKPGPAPAQPAQRWWASPRWALAAMLAVVMGFASWEAFNRFGPLPEGPAATVASLDGSLFRVADNGTVPVKTGDEIYRGDLIRTARDTGAMVRLRDGSMVEMKERSGLSVSETRRDVTIRLARGSVIVEAAKRTSGHLYVSTRDCRVAVTGTVFSVNSGVKGSRVSVVEGEVHVAQGSRTAVLHPGQQYSSSPKMTSVSVAEEISWSQYADQHIALMKELMALGEEMAQQVQMPGARYKSRLVDYLPANTALYGAVPNLGETMADAYQVFQARLSSSPVLQQWWAKEMGGAEGKTKMQQVVDEFRQVGAYLGDEIVIAASISGEGRLGDPVFLAEAKPGLAEFLQAEASKYGDMKVRVVTSAAAIPDAVENELLLYINQGVVAAAPKAAGLRQLAAAIESGAGGFAGTTLYQQIAASYAEGSSFLLSADLEALKAAEPDTEILGNVKHMVIGQKQSGGAPDTRAILTFAGARTGIASWLAVPSPIGALDYVSSGATMVAAAAVKQPVAVVDDLLARLPDFQQDLEEMEAEIGLDVRDQLAAAFGGEFVVALDGPALPVPAWKVVVEVYNAELLQDSLRRITDAVNQKAAQEGKPGVVLAQEEVNGQTYYSIAAPEGGKITEVHYTFVPEGYLIAAPSRVLLDKAISVRASGASLVTAPEFTDLLPRDGHNNFSGMFYHRLGPAIEPLAGILTPEQQQALEGLDDLMEPTLVLAYATEDRIMVATRSQAFGFTPGNLFGLKAPLSLGSIFGGKHGAPGAPEEAVQ